MKEEERMFLHGRIQRNLEDLRGKCADQRSMLTQLVADIGALGKTAAHFGIGAAELKEFFRESCLEEATNWLWCLRRIGGGESGLEGAMRKELQCGGLMLDDIGTTEEELTRLRDRRTEPAEASAAAIEMLDKMTVEFDLALAAWREEGRDEKKEDTKKSD